MTRWIWKEEGWHVGGERAPRAEEHCGDAPCYGDVGGGGNGASRGDEDAIRAEARERILSRFTNLLDDALEQPEPLPELLQIMAADGASLGDTSSGGVAAAAVSGTDLTGHDLYSLWSAVTAVTQEIKVQGRFFKELSDQLQGADLSSLRRLLEQQRGLLAELQRGEDRRHETARRAAQRQLVELLIDLRDRLQRSAEAAAQHRVRARQASRPSWVARMFGRGRPKSAPLLQAADELDKGYRLTLDRLDEALSDLDIRPIDCAGQPFDAQLMAAVDLEETEEAAEGTVLQVYQNGYLQAEELLRPAQVKVARRPSDREEAR